MNKVLIVDDNPSDLKILNAILVKKGFDVTQAADAYSVMDVMAKDKFDLVFLDWMMPNISGIEILKAIRNQAASKNTPVVFVTGKSEARDIKKAIEQGITDYLVKPIDPMILESKISRILKRDDGWRLCDVPDALGTESVVRMKTQITGISEIAVQFKSGYKILESEMLILESEFLKKLGINEVQIRIHECVQKETEYRVLGILIGMKESDLKSIRKYVNSISPVFKPVAKAEKIPA